MSIRPVSATSTISWNRSENSSGVFGASSHRSGLRRRRTVPSIAGAKSYNSSHESATLVMASRRAGSLRRAAESRKTRPRFARSDSKNQSNRWLKARFSSRRVRTEISSSRSDSASGPRAKWKRRVHAFLSPVPEVTRNASHPGTNFSQSSQILGEAAIGPIVFAALLQGCIQGRFVRRFAGRCAQTAVWISVTGIGITVTPNRAYRPLDELF